MEMHLHLTWRPGPEKPAWPLTLRPQGHFSWLLETECAESLLASGSLPTQGPFYLTTGSSHSEVRSLLDPLPKQSGTLQRSLGF